FLLSLMDDPKALLEVMDRSGVWRVGLVNYPSPDVMGFDDSTNTFAAKYAQANPERLLPYGGVHARFTKDPKGDVDRLIDLGIRLLKIHPPHQCFAANAYTEGLAALGKIYRRCEERGLPVMVHTGTSIFRGARFLGVLLGRRRTGPGGVAVRDSGPPADLHRDLRAAPRRCREPARGHEPGHRCPGIDVSSDHRV